MNWLRKLQLRSRAILQKEELDARMNHEIRSHIELQTQENIGAGMSPEEARYAALRQFGWVESIKETCREQRGIGWIENLSRDIRYGTRMLFKNVAFTVVAVLTLALGIGANTAIFSFVNAILLRPLPFKDPQRLVMVFTSYPPVDGHRNWISAPTFNEWRKQSTPFDGLAARGFGGFVLTGKGLPENIPGARFSVNIFRLLGIQPVLGRDFLPEEEPYGKDHVVLLGYELWKRRFGGDKTIVGRGITLNDELYTVIGVLPPRTFFPERDTQLWTPLAFGPEQLHDYGSHNYLVYASLKPGVTLGQANREMNLIASRMAATDEHYKGSSAEVYSLHEMTVGDSRTVLLVLLGAVGLVLLIGCVNIANLLLARSAARSREFAIRGALGASRVQVVRQLLTESMLLALLGGVGGILFALFGLQALVRLGPPDLPRIWEGIHLDMRALCFTAVVTGTAGLLFGFAPALQSSVSDLVRELNEGSRGSSAGRRSQRVRAALVVSEVAVSVMLLVGAGLMIRSFSHLISQNLGYNPENVVSFDLGLPSKKYPTLGAQARFFQQLKAKVDILPVVQAAALVRGLPLSGQNAGGDVSIKGAPPPAVGEAWDADFAQVSPGYFHAMNIPFMRGRDFNERDGRNSAPVAIVNEAFVKKFKLGTNVLGRFIGCAGANDIEVVGVVKDSKRSGLANVQRAEVYRPYAQQCWGFMSLVVRTQSDPAMMIRAIRTELDMLDKDQPIENVRTMTQLVARSVTQRRLSVQMLSGFAGLAMLLAAIGLYGVLAYDVAQRKREIGVRMALGAQQHKVLSLVLTQGMKLALMGTVIGSVAALALTRLMHNLLYQIQPSDPLTFAAVSVLLLGTALLACWVPARRAANVDPMEALRCE
jgi:putative ABC transport system permease protein